jgi:hypothetical protein
VHFCVIDSERLNFDDDVAGPWLRLGHLLDDQTVRAAEMVDDNGFHG